MGNGSSVSSDEELKALRGSSSSSKNAKRFYRPPEVRVKDRFDVQAPSSTMGYEATVDRVCF